ncbi:MAG: adenylosuccinate lyase [Candidatus Buchananbacteria bacterium RIFCSPLOWO2_01_FULL_46_12]|uniref:Adenylosuccinate lyase n=1 Tax=Candidatus Buchananbacteria bacterium RIFCSPLOWO2_01_FULL_46_12 TaxID=1797546 RepID=A0A1G1YRG1_9BACT|nr:MAG: adenylosuccinate lyase [Candidatus Buchananbacteria bacterium RIFCSPLOWO2_01_FULL_46_12]
MIERYTRPEMGELWGELHTKRLWHKVECHGLRAKEQLSLAAPGSAAEAEQLEITTEIIQAANEIETTTDHDLIAFVLAVTSRLSPLVKAFYHVGFTSYCIEDTALALKMVASLDVIERQLQRLCDVLRFRAQEHRATSQMGRTHGIHAEVITFGHKLLTWLDPVEDYLEELPLVRKAVGVGKMSGAVGVYSVDPRIEQLACESLELRRARTSTQVIGRHIHVRYVSFLVRIANSLDRFATEIRNLSRTEIGEVAEHKRRGAKGSSAMPGKSMLGNPIKDENVSGLARTMRGQLIPAFECEVLWHERTLENSAPERIHLPDTTILVDFMLQRFTDTLEKLEVYPEQMLRNINLTGGIIFAQRVMQALTETGMGRPEAYDLLEGIALQVRRGTFTTDAGQTFRQLVEARPEITNRLDPAILEACFDPATSIRFINDVFARFGL